MSDHLKESAFLKSLVVYADSDECRQLQERLAKTDSDARCLHRALRIVGVLAMLCAAGLGYSSVLLDDFFRNKAHPLTQFFLALGATSVIALVFFLGQQFWHRAAVRRLHGECRRRILSVVHSRLGSPVNSCPQPVFEEVDLKIVAMRRTIRAPEPAEVPLSKIS